VCFLREPPYRRSPAIILQLRSIDGSHPLHNSARHHRSVIVPAWPGRRVVTAFEVEEKILAPQYLPIPSPVNTEEDHLCPPPVTGRGTRTRVCTRASAHPRAPLQDAH